nr:hypothetical protein [Sinorhizobium fredii]
MIDLLDLTDRLITADALHCHRRMAQAITERGGDYLLALKGNRLWQKAAQERLTGFTPDRAEISKVNNGRDEWRLAEVAAPAKPLMPGHKASIRVSSGAAQQSRKHGCSWPPPCPRHKRRSDPRPLADRERPTLDARRSSA